MLLHIIRLMDLVCMRSVDLAEIERGSQLWIRDADSNKTHQAGPTSAETFYELALKVVAVSRLGIHFAKSLRLSRDHQ